MHARSFKLESQKAWMQWSKSGARPANIPGAPDQVYKHNGWQGYGHWLGSSNLHTKLFLPFKEALLHARSLKLKTQKEWNAWSKTSARPANMPCAPDQVYKHEGWQGVGHWLGTGNTRTPKQFLPFKEALMHARSLKLETKREWRQWCKSSERPANMPAGPDHIYAHDGWQGYGHWLGTYFSPQCLRYHFQAHHTKQERCSSCRRSCALWFAWG